MFVVNEMKILLKSVTNNLLRINSEKEFIKYLDNYKLDTGLIEIKEMMKKEITKEKFFSADPKSIFEGLRDIDYKNYIDETPYFNAGIFLLPKNSKLPVHDHRNMLVYCKILHGRVNIRSYDKISNKDLDLE